MRKVYAHAEEYDRDGEWGKGGRQVANFTLKYTYVEIVSSKKEDNLVLW